VAVHGVKGTVDLDVFLEMMSIGCCLLRMGGGGGLSTAKMPRGEGRGCRG